MSNGIAKDKPLRFVVTHPEYGTAEVIALDKAAATVEAARLWGAVWREIACECTVSRGRRAPERYCRRCGRRIQGPGLCPECRAAEELARRRAGSIPTRDRRAGMR